MAALEFQAQYLAAEQQDAAAGERDVQHAPDVGDRVTTITTTGWVSDLPKMAAVLERNRPTGVNHHMAWETLTHAGVGDVGLPPITAANP